MWFIDIMRSRIARGLKIAVGVWLLIAGTSLSSLGGLVMMMAGVVLAVTGLAGVCLLEVAVDGWRTRHGATPLPHHHRA